MSSCTIPILVGLLIAAVRIKLIHFMIGEPDLSGAGYLVIIWLCFWVFSEIMNTCCCMAHWLTMTGFFCAPLLFTWTCATGYLLTCDFIVCLHRPCYHLKVSIHPFAGKIGLHLCWDNICIHVYMCIHVTDTYVYVVARPMGNSFGLPVVEQPIYPVILC